MSLAEINSGNKPTVTAVVGGQWGDEGKGKVVDLLAEESDLVIRPCGGNNAGHTVINEQGKFALHLVPSGIFNPLTSCLIGAGVALNPESLISELLGLERKGVNTRNLQISSKAHLTFPYHQIMDKVQESLREGGKIGTTKQGIGPTYADKVDRVGLRAGLLKDADGLMQSLASVLEIKRRQMPSLKGHDEFNPDFYRGRVQKYVDVLGPMVVDSLQLVRESLGRGEKILLEGAQGVLLGIDHGAYPRVTSSETSLNGLLQGAEISPWRLANAAAVFKAYQTRVGEGGMPTERLDDWGEMIREKGHEFGATTGRSRRCGDFDGVAARYAQELNEFSEVVITRLDILSGVGDLRICRMYQDERGQFIDRFPTDDRILSGCRAAYESGDYFEGWSEDLSKIRDWHDLPASAQRYCIGIMSTIPGARLAAIGVGPQRDAVIIVPPSVNLNNVKPRSFTLGGIS